GTHQDAREEASRIPRPRCECRLIKVVQVKVRQAIVAPEATEIFKVQVPRNPGGRGRIEDRRRRPRAIEQGTAAPQEGKRPGPHDRELAGDQAGVTTPVVLLEQGANIGGLHATDTTTLQPATQDPRATAPW